MLPPSLDGALAGRADPASRRRSHDGRNRAGVFVPEATIAQRVSRAKQRIKDAGATFELPPPNVRSVRIDAALHVLYLIFTEGHTASAGATVYRRDLTIEAIRLARQLRERLPGDGEAAGLLALMLLTDARRAARIGADGSIVPLAVTGSNAMGP